MTEVTPQTWNFLHYAFISMISLKFSRRLLIATFLISISALSTGANAQNLSLNLPGQSALGPVVVSEQVRAELLAHAPQGVAPGKPVWVGLQLAHQLGWHSYWKNSGDSGLPTRLEWTLPVGVTAGEIAWPTPQKHWLGNLANYGYKNTVLLPVPLTITPGFKGTQLDVKLQATWLICKEVCIPQDGEFLLRVPVQGSLASNSAAFEAAFAATPRDLPLGKSQMEVAGNALKVSLAGLPAALQGKTLEFFPETGGVIQPAAPWQQSWTGNVWTAQVPLSDWRSESPTRLPVVVALASPAGENAIASWRIEAPVQGVWPAVAPALHVPSALEAALKRNAAEVAASAGAAANNASSLTFLAALLGALLGGIILNLMPCVFPVLAIKVMGVTKHANDRRGHRISGLAYSAGVVLSFVALGALMLSLRSVGEQLGWGFQLQSPAVVAALAVLFTVMGLNLAGVFHFGQFLPSRVLMLESKNPAANAFLSGALAVAVASPCTAPFMGASLGLALGLPALQALLIFATLGVGMALPYLTASLIPAVVKLLPRPGAWMDTFRRAMAFPMFATVVWLVWVLGQQSGIDGAGALLALLVALSLVLWTFTLKGRNRVILATVSIALFGLLIGAIGPNVLKAAEATKVAASGERWQPWAPGRVDQVLATGVPVFVDFTAAWCVICQYNKITLADAGVLADLDAKKVTLLRADWTRRDPAITAVLSQLGRNGVPVYVLYKNGRAPVVLSEILTVQELHSAVAAL